MFLSSKIMGVTMSDEGEEYLKDLEERLCGVISAEGIFDFTTLVFESERGDDIRYLIRDLHDAGYGRTFEEISHYFRGHFAACYRCSEAFQKEMALQRSLDVAADTMAPRRKLSALSRRFWIEHSELGDTAFDLRDYIRLKTTPAIQKQIGYKSIAQYDGHIASCAFCQEFAAVSQELASLG